ncbi:Nucleolar protein 58, partial [Ophiophagus hannah]
MAMFAGNLKLFKKYQILSGKEQENADDSFTQMCSLRRKYKFLFLPSSSITKLDETPSVSLTATEKEGKKEGRGKREGGNNRMTERKEGGKEGRKEEEGWNNIMTGRKERRKEEEERRE